MDSTKKEDIFYLIKIGANIHERIFTKVIQGCGSTQCQETPMKTTYVALLLVILMPLFSTLLFATDAAAKDVAGSIRPFCERIRFCMLQNVANEPDEGDQQRVRYSVNNLMDKMCDMMVAAQIKRGLDTPSEKRAAICSAKIAKMSCDKLLNMNSPYDIQLPQGCNY